MSVQYDERQDRLAVRVSNQDGQEFRLWLTRAMTLRLLPHLQAAVVQLEALDPQVLAKDTTAQQMLAELKRENFLSRADFSTPFTSVNPSLPLGASPMFNSICAAAVDWIYFCKIKVVTTPVALLSS